MVARNWSRFPRATGLPAAIPLKELNTVPSRASPRARSSIPPSGDRRGGETVVFLQGRRKTAGAWVSRMAQGPGTGVSQMMPSSPDGVYPDRSSQVLWEDGERVFCRGWRLGDDGNRNAVLVVLPAAEHPSPSSLDRLAHEYELKDELDGAWAVRPLDLVRDGGRTMLVLEDPGGEPLDGLLGGPMEVERFLRLGIALSAALGRLHERGLIHKDIKPANVLVDRAT